MSELKKMLDDGLITLEAGVLDLRWSYITLELGDDEYLSSIGVVWIINGRVYNPLGLEFPFSYVEYLFYRHSERIVLPRIVRHLELYSRTDRELVLSQYIPSIYISSVSQLEVFDVRCDRLKMHITKFGLYLNRKGLSICSENFYLMKMGVCLN